MRDNSSTLVSRLSRCAVSQHEKPCVPNKGGEIQIHKELEMEI